MGKKEIEKYSQEYEKKQKQKAPAGEKKESWWKRWRKERKEEKEEKRNGFAASSAVWIIFFV
ncbi:MAG: hypothetical protein ABIG10_03970, partial [bacterium]